MVSSRGKASEFKADPPDQPPGRVKPAGREGRSRGGPSRGVIVTLALLLGVKLALFGYVAVHHPAGFRAPDSPSYVLPAQELVQHGTFTRDGRPVLFRTPGYSLFLAPWVAVLGPDHIHFVVLLQIGLSLLVAGMVYACVLWLGETRQAASAALLVAFVDPAWVMGEFSVLSEVVYTVCVTAAVAAVVWYERTRRSGALFVIGLALTAAAFVRPIALYLGVLLLAAVGWMLWRRSAWRHLLVLGLALIVHLGALEAWRLRNAGEFGEGIFTSVQGKNLYAYNAAAVRARAEGLDYRSVHEAHLRDRVSDNPARQARYEQRKALAILARHPVSTVEVTLKGLAVNVFDPGTGALLNLLGLRKAGSGIIYRFQNSSFVDFVGYLWHNEMALLTTTAAGVFWVLAFWTLAVLGLVRVRHTWPPVLWLLLLVVGYHLVLSAGPASTYRFRTPVIPLVAMLAGVGYDSLRERRRRSDGRASPAPATVA